MNGIIVGVSHELEHLIPWWWKNYKEHNDSPVAFVDFGLSPLTKLFCNELGALIPLDHTFSNPTNAALSSFHKKYGYGDFLTPRRQWMKKPLALLLSPFNQTIWIDIDCEVRAPLTPLFTSTFSLPKENDLFQTYDYTSYSSGIIAYSLPCPIIEKWAAKTTNEHADYFGDQDILNTLLAKEKITPGFISESYNWHFKLGINHEAKVIHWAGPDGKKLIVNSMSNKLEGNLD